MTVDIIDKHDFEDRLAGYVSDTPTTMQAVWAQLKAKYPRLIVVGCLDHCLDLFLKDTYSKCDEVRCSEVTKSACTSL